MAGVTALVLTGKKPARWWAYLFVAAMGVARNYLMAHYPSDVLGGAAIAAIVHKAVHMPAVSALTGALAAFCSWLSDDLVRKVTGR